MSQRDDFPIAAIRDTLSEAEMDGIRIFVLSRSSLTTQRHCCCRIQVTEFCLRTPAVAVNLNCHHLLCFWSKLLKMQWSILEQAFYHRFSPDRSTLSLAGINNQLKTDASAPLFSSSVNTIMISQRQWAGKDCPSSLFLWTRRAHSVQTHLTPFWWTCLLPELWKKKKTTMKYSFLSVEKKEITLCVSLQQQQQQQRAWPSTLGEHQALHSLRSHFHQAWGWKKRKRNPE